MADKNPLGFQAIVQITRPFQPTRTALVCPKGYGLCWTCKTWCDVPPHFVPLKCNDVKREEE